ncbi:hypothetical protein BTO30_08695 [Domibacillus antri]|uniref:EamA domain-containing protein n=1 Tax=Domibacillus antri TaxID=1714264 RepID=A0A1Q8Q5J0_9BACI|nr:hypothetical protein BTO30_08695 [Domibacillus antri]
MNKFIYGLLVVMTTALMGSSFAIGKMGLVYFSPLLLVAFRFTIAGVVMAVIVKALKRPHPLKVKQWLQMAAVGFFQTSAVMGFIFLSLRTITSGESAILTFTNPLLVVVLHNLFEGSMPACSVGGSASWNGRCVYYDGQPAQYRNGYVFRVYVGGSVGDCNTANQVMGTPDLK